MMRFKWLICIGGALLLGSAAVHAELRVLFRFGPDGVAVHRVVTIGTPSDHSAGWQTVRPAAPVVGSVLLIWRDQAGANLAVSTLPDPREIHSPGHVTGEVGAVVALPDGAWVADGPAKAATVVVELPESLALGLSAETWTLSLDDAH